MSPSLQSPSLQSPTIRLPDLVDWQGIVYLELTVHVNTPLPPTATLVVHLHQDHDQGIPTGIHARDVLVTGGRRVTELDYVVSFPTSNTVQIDFSTFGDRSPYTVTLLTGGQRALHPFFASADFTFTIDCEVGDCRPAAEEAAPVIPPRPALDLLTKDFRGFVQLLANRAQVVDADWTDHAPAAFERVIVDLLAFVGDRLSYHQDRVANEAFVSTASQRYSLDQHALLLGVPTRPGRAATTTLAFEVSADGYLPEGLEVRMEGPSDESAVAFHVTERTRVLVTRNATHQVVAGWPGATDAVIPAGSTDLRLWGWGLPFTTGDRIAILQGGSAQVCTITSVEELAEPGWTDDPSDPTLTTTPQEITRYILAESLRFTIQPWATDPALTVYGNLVPARHGARRVAWVSPANPPSRAEVDLTLSAWNSTVVAFDRGGTTVQHLRQLQVPEGPVLWVLAEDDLRDGGYEPLLTVAIGGADGEVWTRKEHLHNSRSFDRHYVAEMDNDGGLWLRFGDGIHGREIEVNTNGGLAAPLKLTWWIGEPVAGNVATRALNRAMFPPEDVGTDGFDFATIRSVTNVAPGAGGLAADTLDQIRERIPESIRHGVPDASGQVVRLRAVTLDDYARAAEDVAGVGRAVARALRTPFNTVLVLVDPAADDALSDTLAADVQAHLDEVRMAGREVIVRQADYVPLEVSLAVCAEAGYPKHEVRARVYAALRPGTDENPGWFHPDQLSFGESVELGELLAYVQGLDGVCSVKALLFKPLLRTDVADVMQRITLESTQVARMDGDDDFPENGALLVQVFGLDLPDAAIDAYLIEGASV